VRVLLDECLPGRKLKPAFPSHDVRTVADMGWRGVKNGALLARAEAEFDAFVTVDGSTSRTRRAWACLSLCCERVATGWSTCFPWWPM
jgi:hypothetical protein